MEKPDILKKRTEPIRLSDKPKVSVITTSFNLARFIEETMNSVENQSTFDYEHIVIDGASKDNSLEIYKKYPHIRLLSEKDTGYPDAFWKGVRMARGEYIIQVPISDCLADKDWLKKCIEVLDKNKDISLVWGFRGKLSEKSEVISTSKIPFPKGVVPEAEDYFKYWLATFFVYPEGNLFVRKSVLEKCYPTLEELKKENMLDWLEFSYRFNKLGFLSKNIPILASYGRVHDDQMGEAISMHGKLKGMYKNYWSKIRNYRLQLILGKVEHNFIDHNGNKVKGKKFNRKEFIKEYLGYLMVDGLKKYRKYFSLKKYIAYFKKRIIKI